ncbi:Myb/SANT-like DNA-binding domain protein [Sesbania bispinosa]|nr:Myb/SANT-like DNA-binding domain protein [Sesbania bispinosa]
MSNNPAKRKWRQSGGAAKLSSQIDTLVSNSSKALEIMHSKGSVSKDNGAGSTVVAAMTIINRMVNDGSELWGFALSFIENEVRRQIFLNLETGASRKACLMYMHAKEK